MDAESVSVTLPEAQTALCGFRHCRRPLPPPGPRGGRPYEFCPDRTWPGDKTCKQLAAAENALREALGETDPPTALRDATDTFAEASRQVREPLQALGDALDTVQSRIQDELASAATRADEADTAAEAARRAQSEAEERAAEAQRRRDEAVADAQQARAEAEEARTTAEGASAATEAAQLAQARAEATAEAAADRARRAEDENKVVRTHADELVARLDDLRGQLAERTGERDTARATLDEHRQRSQDLERSLTERLETATTQLDDTRAELSAATQREQELARTLEERAAEHRTVEQDLATARGELSDTRGALERLRTDLAQTDEARAAAERVLRRVNDAVLAAGDDPASVREDVLRELLTRDGSGAEDDPQPEQ